MTSFSVGLPRTVSGLASSLNVKRKMLMQIITNVLTENASSRQMKPIGCGSKLFERASNEDERKTFKIMVCQPAQGVLGSIAQLFHFLAEKTQRIL